MLYTDKTFFLCRIPLSAEGPQDVEIKTKAENISDFPRVFQEFEDARSHAFNKDGLFSIVRADEIFCIVRTTDPKNAKQMAFDDSKANLITNLQHRVMQGKDEHARNILKTVHEVDTKV